MADWQKKSYGTTRWGKVSYGRSGLRYAFGHGAFGHRPFGHGGRWGAEDPWTQETDDGLYFGFGVGPFGKGSFGSARAPGRFNR